MGLLDQQDIHERITIESRVAEMGPIEASTVTIPVDEMMMEKIKRRDSDPEFVTVEVVSGMSKNKRNYTPQSLQKVAQTVNEKKPVGYLGHIPESDLGNSLPPPQTLWLSAKTEQRNGKTVLYIKGYNRDKDVRDYIDLGMVDAVSISGEATMRSAAGGYDVIDFDLESIDWARKGKNSMPSRIVSITREMEGGNTGVDGKDIAAISEAELRQYNPTLIELLEGKTTGPMKERVAEMEATIEKQKGFSDLIAEVAKRLKAEPEKILESIDELLAHFKVAKSSEVKNYITQLIKDKVKTERGQKLVTRLVGEMEDITELDDDAKKEIEKRVTDTIEGDEDIKAIVSEMVDSSAGTGGAQLGGRSSNLGTGNGVPAPGVVSDNENLTVTKTTL